jgi:O-antigen ligase
MFSFSRGGMLALIILGLVTFLLIDKKPMHFAYFGLSVAIALMLAGPEVRQRFAMSFAEESERDSSAQSRVDLWSQCWIVMQENPLFGVGPDNWVFQARDRFGWGSLKEAHSLWMQTGAELGFLGVGFLALFYLLTMARLWPLARTKSSHAGEWDIAIARMVIAAITGFMVAAQFVTLEGLELPYYIILIGAGTLKLLSMRRAAQPGFSQVLLHTNSYWLLPSPAARPVRSYAGTSH